MRFVFWFSAAVIAYVYVGYPTVLAIWAAVCRRRTSLSRPSVAECPGVSIVLAARNEGRRLPGRIENLFSLDYPGDRQIIVVSDGSTDNTVDALQPYRDRVEVVAVPAMGKAAALNAGVARARYDI